MNFMYFADVLRPGPIFKLNLKLKEKTMKFWETIQGIPVPTDDGQPLAYVAEAIVPLPNPVPTGVYFDENGQTCVSYADHGAFSEETLEDWVGSGVFTDLYRTENYEILKPKK